MDRRNYRERREYMQLYQRLWVAKRRAAFFADKSCVRCGSASTLELDHVDPASKDPVLRARENNAMWSWSEARRLAEIAKCQVLCHSCHLDKTRENHESLQGSQHPSAKLNEQQVYEIRRLHAAGRISYDKLAERFQVSKSTVRDIIKRNRWTHI